MRLPHVITDIAEVHDAVERLSRSDVVCIDVETREKVKDNPNPRTNEVTWLGIGGPGQVYLIPLSHPKGVTLVREHRDKTPACMLYDADDPRSKTKTGQVSMRMVEHTVPATFASPPVQLSPAAVFEAVRPLLFSDRAKLGHNVKFDLQTIAKYYGGEIPPGPYHDTILIRHVLTENLPDYTLKTLTMDWLGIPLHRRKRFYPNLGKAGVDSFGLDEVARYLAKDIRYCWLQFQFFYPRLIARGLQPIYDFEMSVYPVLMDIEQAGFCVDGSNLGQVKANLEQRLHELEEQCWIAAGGQFPLSNTEAKRWVLFGHGRPAPTWDLDKARKIPGTKLRSQNLRALSLTEETKVPQVTQAVLKYYADRGNHMAEWFLEWSLLEKLRGTFVEGLSKMLTPHERGLPTIHTSFKQHGTVTGRLSSASPNLQQLPRGSRIRDLFVAGPGHVLIVADYDQIELRCVAHQSGDPVMTQVFKQGSDIHAQATAAALRIPVGDVTPDLRQVGKTLNFATLYGATKGKIASVAGGSEARGQQFLDRYYAQFAALKPWKARMLREARARGDRANFISQPPAVLIPPIGRLRRLPDLYNPEDWKRWRAERQAINAIIQGFASNITKMAMLGLHSNLAELPAWMVVQVHDEIVVCCQEDWVDEVLPIVVSTMGDIRDSDGGPILGDEIPLLASAGVGYSWSQAKGK